MEKKKNTKIKPFYKTANALLIMKINTIEDIKNFYIGINNLASEITSNTIFIEDLGSLKYSDNLKLHRTVNHILGYGQVIGKSKLFTRKLLKEVNLNTFLEKNPQAKNKIKATQKEAQVYFYNLLARIEKLEEDSKNKDERIARQDSIIKESSENIEKLKKEVAELKKITTYPPKPEEIIVGSLIYKEDGSICYKQTPIKMRFQMRSLCILFMKNHKNLVSYDTIRDEIIAAKKRSTITFVTITKYVSELQMLLDPYLKKQVLFNQGKEAYIFDIDRNS